jgi:pimeloyl-ACP methyl ester carboxylesterase
MIYPKAVVGAVALLLLPTAACSTPDAGTPAAQKNQPAAPIEWGTCDQSGDLPKVAQCGSIAVPVDYSKPDGAVAQIALIRFPATGQRIGSLVMNPGGPGQSGVDGAATALESLPAGVHERFDLVGFDPRGIGASTPALRCNTDAENDADRADPYVDFSPAGIADIEDSEKQYVQRCVDKMGTEFLANVGTVNVAQDLDRIRTALGDDKLSYLGYGYGTLIGSAYAEAFPDKVRAMILDGAIDPTADPMEFEVEQSASFQQAFNDYAADCATKPDCPLGTDPTKAVSVYRSLVDPLVVKPARTKDPRGLGYQDALTGTFQALYSPSTWKDLTEGLRELTGGQGDSLLALADSYMERDENGHYSNSTDAFTAIHCVDGPPVTDRAKVAEQDRRERDAAPFMSYGEFTGGAPLWVCAFWPVPPTSTPQRPSVTGLPPVLVVSTTGDPATPYQAGVDLAKDLGGSLLTFDGTQHTVVFQGDACVDGYAEKYLIDLTLPPSDAKC